ncbi:hypothetical protein GTW43_12520 [Streptomyces sp. SID5785]|uniref:hypothetical protein n=1 Tax=Streptomyces sp. SID5785 TaxID=2690309 RepID=UPI001361D265|nr:hypothetical protein [Streptomyces sp. SID5785]MZD05903.1 hypothetical protein [Streptomyces sp. SID5785]
MTYLGLPGRGPRRAAATASVLLLPLVLGACSDDGTATPPPAATPAATASGARCATDPLPADPAAPEKTGTETAGTETAGTETPGTEKTGTEKTVSGAYTVEGGRDVSTPRRKRFSARTADRSAVLVSGPGTLSTRDSGVHKSGRTTSVTASGAQGLNAAVLVRDGGGLALSGGEMTTSGRGATGVFATGEDTRATMSANRITATGASARGVTAARGASLALRYTEIRTAGAQSPPVAAGPGGGRVTVSGGTMTSAGCGSPGVLTAGDVSLSGTLFTVANSEAFTVEPGGSLSLENVRSSAAAGGVLLRGSGETSYTMEGGSLQAAEGDVFTVRETVADVRLKGRAEVTTKDGALLRVRDSGSVTFEAEDERLHGDVLVSDGSAAVRLTGSTRLDGRVKGASLSLGAGTRWTVGGDSRVEELTLRGGVSPSDVIVGNGHDVSYDRAASPGLGGRTYRLAGGGVLRPA